MRLADREGFGCLSGPGGWVKYQANGQAPRRVKRAVKLVNYADGVAGEGFDTYEDRPVTWSKKAMMGLLLVVVGIPLALLQYWLGDRDLLFVAGIPIVGVIFLNLAPTMLGGHETICEFLASRIFGAPCRPRYYIELGQRRGWVTRADENAASGKANE